MSVSLQKASFWKRISAFLFDNILLLVAIVGIMALLSVQVFFNIGVVTNFLPATGISLPFFSYGGTSLIILLMEMGVVLSISKHSYQKK